MSVRRVSMSDVARLVGVSAQTVSRVVNGSPRVDPVTRARVEHALNESGYRVHRAARALRTGRSGTIGAVVSTLSTAGNSLMLEAVADAAAARGFNVTVALLGDGSVSEAIARLREQGVDGAVIVNEATAASADETLPADLPLVFVDAPPERAVRSVQTDHVGGARAATEHLLDLGHGNVAHIGGPPTSFAARAREAGWREALAARGISPGAVEPGSWTAESGYTAAKTLIRRAALGTAVFVANDQMALGALRALAEHGLEVPGDVSVVGFDDVSDAANFRPPLTTIRQPFHKLGARAVEILVAAFEAGPDADGSELAAVRHLTAAVLIERMSTAAPSAH